MSKLINALSSTVGRKYLTGITGIGLILFTIVHLLGNLSLFIGPNAFNLYTHKLESIGPILYVIEIALAICFILHAITGVSVYLNKKKARPVDYSVYNSAGGNSKQNFSSRSMMVTGSVIMLFLILHISTLKFGPNIEQGYVTNINGVDMRDLYRLVIEKFKQLPVVIVYTVVMILLGTHLRHGFWSAFQSLGVLNKKYRPFVYSLGVLVAVLLSAGFLILPVWIYFFVEVGV
jgi:succinate dehydrogenase / fumarate reductase cytochrome b subunit